MVLLARAEGMPEGEESIPRLIGEGRVDGVLVQVGDNMRPQDLRDARRGHAARRVRQLDPRRRARAR